jgi:hypothetical protein
MGGIVKSFLGPIGKLIFGGLAGGGKTKVQQPVTSDVEREAQDAGDELRRRKGAAADMITGTRGAEAAASSVGKFVSGS